MVTLLLMILQLLLILKHLNAVSTNLILIMASFKVSLHGNRISKIVTAFWTGRFSSVHLIMFNDFIEAQDPLAVWYETLNIRAMILMFLMFTYMKFLLTNQALEILRWKRWAPVYIL